jgi:hypothetical protein
VCCWVQRGARTLAKLAGVWRDCQLAGPARAAQADLAGGADRIVISVTTLLLIIIIVILVAW